MAEKKITTTLTVEEKSFTNKDNGEIVNYKDCSISIAGVDIKISIKQDSRKLFDYLLKKV